MGRKYTFTDAGAENIAAIAWHLGQSPFWNKAYKAAADSMGGSIGFYQAAMEMASSLEDYTDAKSIEWGNSADWTQTVEALTDMLLHFMTNEGRLPSAKERTGLIKGSIVRY